MDSQIKPNAATPYTEGPWMIRKIEDDDFKYEIGGAGASDRNAVACVFQLYKMHPEVKANAQLISAAPAPLEALEILLSDFEMIVSNGYTQPAYYIAKEAIKKATIPSND